uniref:Uncharacterized protein n=1 Tax=Thermomicrobium roseum TaxID=500 RepID=A0A7C2BFI2_THERO
MYDAARTRRWLHDLEHITFFLGALLYRWLVVGAPLVRRHFHSDARRAVSRVLGGTQSSISGIS